MSAALRERIARLELLARAHPDSRVLLHLAEAHRRAGSLDEARRVLERGLARQPQDAAARVLLGRVLLDLGRWNDAQSAFRAALADAPDHMEVVALRALGELAALWRTEAALGAAGHAPAPGAREHGAAVRAPPPRGGTRPAAGDAPPAGPAAVPPAAAPAATRGEAARPRAAGAATPAAGAPALEELPWEEMMLVTETLAELYAAQGLTGQALALYRELLAARPGDARILARLRELSGEGAGDAAPAAGTRSSTGEALEWTAPERAAGGLEISFLRMADPGGEPEGRPLALEARHAPEPPATAPALHAADGPAPERVPETVPEPAPAPASLQAPVSPAPDLPPVAASGVSGAGAQELAAAAAEPPLEARAEPPPEGRPAGDVHDDFDWLFAPTPPPPLESGVDAWTHLVALGDLALDALEEQRATAATAARHVRRLARAAAQGLHLDAATLVALELAAQLLGITVPAGAGEGARDTAAADASGRGDEGAAAAGPAPAGWIAAALSRVDTADLPLAVVELLRDAAAVAAEVATDPAAVPARPLAARVLAAAAAFRAELASRGRGRAHPLREAAEALWEEADLRYGRDVVTALLAAVAQDPALALPRERRVLIVGGDDVEAAATAQPFRAAGDRVERVRSPGDVRAPLLGAEGHTAVVLLGDVSVERATLLARELRDALGDARPVLVATGIADTAGRTALLAAGADLCFGPAASRVEVHAATTALLRRLGEASDARAAGARAADASRHDAALARGAPASGQEPGARRGVRPGDNAGSH